MTATEVHPRDQVRVTLTGEAKNVYNGAGEIDMTLEGGGTVYDIPLSYVVVTKKAPPPEPAIGSIIQYYANDKYIRLSASGWSFIPAVTGARIGSIPAKWEIFDHANVKVLHSADVKTPVPNPWA